MLLEVLAVASTITPVGNPAAVSFVLSRLLPGVCANLGVPAVAPVLMPAPLEINEFADFYGNQRRRVANVISRKKVKFCAL